MSKFKVGQRVWLKSQKKYGRITGLNDSKTAYQIEPIDFNFTKTRELPFTFRYFLAEDLHQTADDMFEALGFEKDDKEMPYITYEKSMPSGRTMRIIFYPADKSYRANLQVLPNEHLAIHQQMVELGWL